MTVSFGNGEGSVDVFPELFISVKCMDKENEDTKNTH